MIAARQNTLKKEYTDTDGTNHPKLKTAARQNPSSTHTHTQHAHLDMIEPTWEVRGVHEAKKERKHRKVVDSCNREARGALQAVCVRENAYRGAARPAGGVCA